MPTAEQFMNGAGGSPDKSGPSATSEKPLAPADIAAFHRDGFVIVKGFFTAQEIESLREACRLITLRICHRPRANPAVLAS
jgi:hypothetical protein